MKRKFIMVLCVLVLLPGCGDKRKQELSAVEPITAEITDISTEALTEEAGKEENTSEEKGNVQEEDFAGAKMMHKYSDVLSGFSAGKTPEDEELEYMESGETPNQYAIYDIDGDGREELIVLYMESTMAGMRAWIYDYHADTDEVVQEFSEFPALTFYDNGAIKADSAHNQGKGPNFWPYNLYAYDSGTDSYIYQGSVDTWDKQFMDEDYDGTPFPDELDTDGDGILYYLDDGSADGEGITANQAEYEAWYQSVIGDASELELPWKFFDIEEISSYREEYMSFLFQRIEEQKTTDVDLGFSFLQNNGDIERIGEEIVQNTGIQLQRVDNPDVVAYIGTADGEEVYESCNEDAGWVVYFGKKVENVTLFGIYPGMPETDAQKLLNERGFYLNDYEIYVTGEGFGNYCVYLDSEEGLIRRITVMNYTRYAG